MSNTGQLFVVGTPIGNLEDVTLRAISTLQSVDIILAEDTRNSKKLLDAHKIETKMISYHEHSNDNEIKKIIDLLLEGKDLALISDAGTPTISDPGYGLIRDCIKHDIVIVPIPGVSAITAAMSVSGLPSDSFTFFGFLPQKKGRLKKIELLKNIENTVILFESPYRLEKTLNQLLEHLGNRSVVVGRELTKLYEEVIRGNLTDVIKYFSKSKVKGEIVIMIGKDDDRINF
ncbi:MAG: 16S rRNA (cytidine(1402)-2'-O)-methyltransferase [Candidatus Neomarinimicrobiota bacterium]|jgi:16S rRNA (cytidine1402-2'-O)-methyltransferase|tara:strand:+ start:819 stop:1511 length:693 start_codon:yes stop_codon:yes gene_type:complete